MIKIRFAETIIDEETNDMILGMAFHWYSGDHFEALRMLREKYPDRRRTHCPYPFR